MEARVRSSVPPSDMATVNTLFEISGEDFDPDWCTEALGLVPTRCWRKGDLRGRYARVPSPLSRWGIESGASPARNVEDGLRIMLDTVWPVRDRLRRMREEWRAPLEVGCASIVKVRSHHAQAPQVQLSAESLERLADLDLEYCPDIYDFRRADRTGLPPGSSADSADTRPFIDTLFELTGDDLDPAACTELLGVQPTAVIGPVGTERAAGALPAPGSWVIEIKDRRDDETERGLNA